MRVIGNSINAAVLIVSTLFIGVNFLLESFERRLGLIGFGAGPRTGQDWLEVLFVWVCVYFLLTVYF